MKETQALVSRSPSFSPHASCVLCLSCSPVGKRKEDNLPSVMNVDHFMKYYVISLYISVIIYFYVILHSGQRKGLWNPISWV